MDAMPSVEDVLGRVAIFSGRTLTYTALEGGLSHHIWRVRCGATDFVVRILDPAVSAAGLGVDPAQEIANTLLAAESGVGARVVEVPADVPAIVLEFLPGRTLAAADMGDPITMARIAAAVRRLHAGARFGNEFSIAAKLAELLDICRRHELRLPEGYADRLPTVDAVQRALAAAPAELVACHNDLLPANFIDAGTDIRIVDYQLSGNNDPTFELGNIAAEALFDTDRTEALCEAYFGTGVTATLVARTRLNLLLSNVTWTLWFCVHHGLLRRPGSTFDYWTEASDKWQRAQRDLDNPELGRLLDKAS